MISLLDLVFDYRVLLSKEQDLHIALDDNERAKLLGLAQLLKGDHMGSRRRRMPRLPTPFPVQFTIPGGFGSGQIRDISGGGLAIVTRRRLRYGTRTIIRVARPGAGCEYVFPGRVVWMKEPVVGVAFDGVPSEAPFVVPHTAQWRGVRFGMRRSRPMVA